LVVKVRNNLTLWNLTDVFEGGAKRRPVRFERGNRSALPCRQAGRRAFSRLAVCQNEVQPENLLGNFLLARRRLEGVGQDWV